MHWIAVRVIVTGLKKHVCYLWKEWIVHRRDKDSRPDSVQWWHGKADGSVLWVVEKTWSIPLPIVLFAEESCRTHVQMKSHISKIACKRLATVLSLPPLWSFLQTWMPKYSGHLVLLSGDSGHWWLALCGKLISQYNAGTVSPHKGLIPGPPIGWKMRVGTFLLHSLF